MRRIIEVAAVMVIVLSGSLAYAFNSGSTGALGAFNPTTNTVVQLPPDGILNYTTINIPAGVTVTFTTNAANTPVYMLATQDVIVAGTINVSGQNGAGGTGTAAPVLGGQGGPGGFAGGFGGVFNAFGGQGLGPGGGGPGSTVAVVGQYPGSGGGGGFGASGNNGSVPTAYATGGGRRRHIRVSRNSDDDWRLGRRRWRWYSYRFGRLRRWRWRGDFDRHAGHNHSYRFDYSQWRGRRPLQWQRRWRKRRGD
jgi:hypothetical protein